MVNTSRYVLNSREMVRDSIMSRVNSLHDKGIIMRPSAATEIVGVDNSRNLGYLLGPNYEDIRDAINDIFNSGIDINNYNLSDSVRDVIIRYIDHDKTRSTIANHKFDNKKCDISDAYEYLNEIKKCGVSFVSSKTWRDIIPKCYIDNLHEPVQEIELASYSGKLITRCLPGWSNAHLEPMYKLQQGWISGDEIEEVVREEMKNGLDITDGLCRKCYEYMLKMN